METKKKAVTNLNVFAFKIFERSNGRTKTLFVFALVCT